MKYDNMKKLLALIAASFLAFPIMAARPVSAADAAPVLQSALDNAKQSLDDLVTAKDEDSSDDVGLRVQTFGQVIDLSEAEAKDFEFKLLAIPKDDKLDAWKKSVLAGFDSAIAYFESEKQSLTDPTSTIDLAGIKQMAQDFKTWRDANYLPLTDQAQDFILIKKEYSAITTAKSRLDKITSDLKGLNQPAISNSADIKKSLDGSKSGINDATTLNQKAYDMFVSTYASATSTLATSTLATSTAATSTPETSSTPIISSSTATSSEAAVSQPPIVSIKDLVTSSLNRIKDSYQGFIDISNSVRKLLK